MAAPCNDDYARDYVRREEEDGVEQEVHRRNQDVQAVNPAIGNQSRFFIACSVVGVVWFVVSLILFAYFNAQYKRELNICSTLLSEESRSSLLKGGDYKTCIKDLQTCSYKLETCGNELTTHKTELSKAQGEVKTCNSEKMQLYRKEGEYNICHNELGKCKRLLSKTQEEVKTCDRKEGECNICQNELKKCKRLWSKAQEEVKTCDRKEGVCEIWQKELKECKGKVNNYIKERDSSNDENSYLKSQLASCETGRLHGYILIAIPTLIIFCCFFNRGPKLGSNSELKKID
uniref:Uncharacterized protein n=1 Tax=Amphimedon queenslandica TaxID=400682 RepID=A0A1X7V1T1_AMPQE